MKYADLPIQIRLRYESDDMMNGTLMGVAADHIDEIESTLKEAVSILQGIDSGELLDMASELKPEAYKRIEKLLKTMSAFAPSQSEAKTD